MNKLPPLVNREMVAAYLLDRADQYETSSASWVGLADAAQAIMDGTFDEAVYHGELDDDELLVRARDMGRNDRS